MSAQGVSAAQLTARVEASLALTPHATLLRLERGDVRFQPGQCLLLGLPGEPDCREYSIYSACTGTTLDVLVRRVEDGVVSSKLCDLRAGDRVAVDGPVGYFTLPAHATAEARFLFVASGTGIAPFHSMVTSFDALDYELLHGVRTAGEAYERDHYAPGRYTLCTSRDDAGDYRGRVTGYLQAHPVETDRLCYLCGNAEMIDEVYDILVAQGVPAQNLHAEVYF